jgi:hypothetical protein
LNPTHDVDARVEQYELMAAECLRLASAAADEINKALLLEMARNWVRLAEQIALSEMIGKPSSGR